MKRYNIDTDSYDLIQFDLEDSWTIQNEHDKVVLVINKNNEETGHYDKGTSIVLSKNDLEKINAVIVGILPKKLS